MDIFGIKYDHVMSIGHSCGCASYLNKFGLRSVSGPFDWAGTKGGVLANVELLMNGFAGAFDLEQLEDRPVPEDVRETGNKRFVVNPSRKLVFAHDFPRAQTVEEVLPGVRDRYARRSKRMREILASPGRHLLIGWNWVAPEQSDADILLAASRLREAFPRGTINLIYMQNVEGAEGLDEKELAPGVVRYRGWFHEKGVNFTLGNIALNSRIFSRIRARGMWRNLLRLNIDKYKRRLKTQLHFSATARREARKKYKRKAWEF